MLQKIRDGLQGQRWLAMGVLGALALVFAAWGAYGIVDLKMSGGAYAAKVEGEKIPIDEARQAWAQQQAQFSQRLGGAELPDAFKQQLQNELLEEMVRAVALSAHAKELGYRVTEEQIHKALREVPAFQIDGKYDANVAKERLAQAGISLSAFEADLRRGLQRGQIQKGIQASEFVTPLELERLHALEDEQREVRYISLTADKFAGTAPVDDAAVQGYLKKNQSSYLTPESVRLVYGELRLDQLAAQTAVTEADLREAYDKSKDRYVQAEKRRAHHVLIKEAPDALKKAQDVLAQAKSGKDFATLAKQYSQDTGSASQGGDLGWAERNYFVGPFADALFTMQPGEIRGPVKTQFGYHIIKLDEIQPGKTRTFEEARAEIESQLRRDRAQDQLGDVQEQIARKLDESNADFDALVKEFHLQTGEVAGFQRGVGGAPLGAAPELQEVVFSAPVLNDKRVGGPLVLGEDRLVIVKALEHHQPAPRPLAEVRDEIVAAIRKEHGIAAAEKAADTARARLLSGASFDDVAKELGVAAEPARFVGRKDPSVPTPVRTVVFEIPKPAGKPIFRTAKLDDGGAAVVAITASRRDPSGSAPDRKMARTGEAAAKRGAGDVAAYIEELRRNADVSKNPKAFE
jgi:peptidyl-prolyl cis-trans isomerase D